MKAVILAGGYGTRLRPITCTIPKILLPVANKTVIEYIYESYPFEEIILTVNWLGDNIKTFVSQTNWTNINICHESNPLGTGGAIKNVERYLDDTFIVFNGDMLSSLNISEFVKFHKRKNALATDALFSSNNIERFGVVEIDEGKITRFIEKPSGENALGNLINAGIYCFEPEILDLFDPNTKISLERDIFPKIVEKGNLYGYYFNGFWFDIGNSQDYIEANIAFSGQSGLSLHNSSIISGKIMKSAIGRNCEIADSEILNTVISDNVHITHSYIVSSIISTNAQIENARLEKCIIGDSAIVTGNWKNKKVCPGEELR